MPRLKSLTGKQIIEILSHHGFLIVRQHASHVRLKHPDGRATTVPIHRHEHVGRGLLRKIIRDSKLKLSEFQ